MHFWWEYRNINTTVIDRFDVPIFYVGLLHTSCEVLESVRGNYPVFFFDSLGYANNIWICQIELFIWSKSCKLWHRSFKFNSNKSPTWCNNFSVYYPDFCLQLNMFRAFSRPAGPTTNTARLSPRYEGKTRGCHCSHWAPDDGQENARNMLSCKQTSG